MLNLAEDHNKVMELAGELGMLIEKHAPRVEMVEGEGCWMIPGERLDEVTEVFTTVIAEMIQAWIDAGSEREVTLEELHGPIRKHLKGWSTHCEPGKGG